MAFVHHPLFRTYLAGRMRTGVGRRRVDHLLHGRHHSHASGALSHQESHGNWLASSLVESHHLWQRWFCQKHQGSIRCSEIAILLPPVNHLHLQGRSLPWQEWNVLNSQILFCTLQQKNINSMNQVYQCLLLIEEHFSWAYTLPNLVEDQEKPTHPVLHSVLSVRNDFLQRYGYAVQIPHPYLGQCCRHHQE